MNNTIVEYFQTFQDLLSLTRVALTILQKMYTMIENRSKYFSHRSHGKCYNFHFRPKYLQGVGSQFLV